jgi:hypothetical protein
MDVDQCVGCQRCLQRKPGKQKSYPCEEAFRAPLLSLLELLKKLFSKKRWRELRGRMKPGTHRREKASYRPERVKRQKGPSAWQTARRTTVPSGYEISSESPRIVTAAIYGPNAMARNFFPDVLESPRIQLTEKEALRLTIEDQRRKLRKMYRR